MRDWGAMLGRTLPDSPHLFPAIVNTHPEARLRFGVGLCVLFFDCGWFGQCRVASTSARPEQSLGWRLTKGYNVPTTRRTDSSGSNGMYGHGEHSEDRLGVEIQ